MVLKECSCAVNMEIQARLLESMQTTSIELGF